MTLREPERRSDERTPPVRHRAGRAPSGVGALLKVVGIVVLVLAMSSGSIAAIAAWRLETELQNGAVDISNGGTPSVAAYNGAFNVLLVGADNTPGQHGFGAARDASLNDVNILVHVAADHKSGIVMSIPRDLVIPHPACVDPKTKATYPAMFAQPLNAAFARGGLGCVVATVHALTGIDIPYAALFSFQGTAAMADAVGGVPICLTGAVHDPASGLDLPKGVSTVSGRTALAYLRERHQVGDGSDLSRISSQQAYMSSLMRKMTASSTLTSPDRLYGLASAAAKYTQLSSTLADPNTMVGMMVALKGISLSHMVFVQYPTGADPENPNKVIPDAELAPVLTHRIIRDTSVGLDGEALGANAQLASSHSGKSASPSPAKSSKSTKTSSSSGSKHVLHGLRGQTADERTCSVART